MNGLRFGLIAAMAASLIVGMLAVFPPAEANAQIRSRSVSRSRTVSRGNAQQLVAVQHVQQVQAVKVQQVKVQQVRAVHHHRAQQFVAPVYAAQVYAAPLQLVVPQQYVAPQQLQQGCSTGGLQLNAGNSCAAFWP